MIHQAILWLGRAKTGRLFNKVVVVSSERLYDTGRHQLNTGVHTVDLHGHCVYSCLMCPDLVGMGAVRD